MIFWGKYRFQGVTDISARGKFRLVFENQYLSQSFPSRYTNSKEKAQVRKFLKNGETLITLDTLLKLLGFWGRSKNPIGATKSIHIFILVSPPGAGANLYNATQTRHGLHQVCLKFD